MKVIDLLNVWVEDKNKLPKKIKIDNIVFEYNKELNFYKESNKDYYLIQNFLVCAEALHKKVEVIEENKDIEEIEELNEMQIINARPEVNAEKINELVRAVNKLNKERDEK